MGLLAHKRKISIDEICLQFYYYEVFQNETFCATAFDFVNQANTLSPIDRDLFRAELTALRIELFGLALYNQNLELSKREEYKNPKEQDLLFEEACNEILIAKAYLQLEGRTDIWNLMAFYNEDIGRALDEEPINLSGLQPAFPSPTVAWSEEKRREFFSESSKQFRQEMSRRLQHYIVDPECIARLVN